jgi:Ca2+-binding RTX toxin-like protein
MLSTNTITLANTANRSNPITTLVIFDSQVADLPLLYKALLPGSIAHTIQPDRDPIDHITHLLTQTGATKLAIVAHGQPGAIEIGNGVIDRAMLEARSGLLQEWGLDSIALYACEVGADTEFINRFAELTGAKIAASNNKLGAGNWELDGGMELLEIGQLADYNHTLVTFTGTGGNDTADSIGFGPFIPPYLTGFTGGTVVDLTDNIGDIFDGLDGSDSIYAGNGDDRINADYVKGSNNGGGGNDFLNIYTAVAGKDYKVVFTAPNAGTLYINGVQTGTFTSIEQLRFLGFDGNDTIDASFANLIVTAPGASYAALDLNGDGGNDTLIGSDGNDKIDGGPGGDTITGNAGSNILDGGSGDDRIDANYMRDTVDGGTGNDFLYINTPVLTDANTVIFTGANAGKFQINGADTGTFTGIEQLRFIGYQGNDVINANLANLSVTTPGAAEGLGTFGLYISTDAGNDIVLGSAGKDFIDGGYGDDALYGQGGDDTIFGSEGFDVIYGGAGIDTIRGGATNDFIFGGTEDDIINGDDGEDYLYGEDGNDTIKGGYGFDVIYGLAGDDYLYGEGVTLAITAFNDGDLTAQPAAGIGINDTIFGGIGNDNIIGGIGDDVLLGEEGNDSIRGSSGNDFVYGGIGNDSLYGGAGNDYLVGQDGIDNLNGGDGIDYLEGGNGNDVLDGGDNDDYLYGNTGIDVIDGGDGNDFLDGGDGNDTLNGGLFGNDVLFGVEGDDFLSGKQGNDYLYGGNGNDSLNGGNGSDFLIGGAGSDKFEYSSMTDAGDTITDFNPLAGGDNIDLTYLFAGLGVLSGNVNIDYLRFVQFGTSTAVQVDQDGTAGSYSFVTLTTLNNITASSLVQTLNVLVNGLPPV